MSYHFNYKTLDGADKRCRFENSLQAPWRYAVVRFRNGLPDREPFDRARSEAGEYAYRLERSRRSLAAVPR